MKILRPSRGFMLPTCLTLTCLLAAMHLDIAGLGVRPASANPMPECPHAGCYGPEMCYYSRNQTCVISGQHGPCTVSWCTRVT